MEVNVIWVEARVGMVLREGDAYTHGCGPVSLAGFWVELCFRLHQNPGTQRVGKPRAIDP